MLLLFLQTPFSSSVQIAFKVNHPNWSNRIIFYNQITSFDQNSLKKLITHFIRIKNVFQLLLISTLSGGGSHWEFQKVLAAKAKNNSPSRNSNLSSRWNNNCYLLGICYLLGLVLSTLYKGVDIVFMSTMRSRCYYPYFTYEKLGLGLSNFRSLDQASWITNCRADTPDLFNLILKSMALNAERYCLSNLSF